MSVQNPKNKFPLNVKWDFTQIDVMNRTNFDVTANIFNTVTLTNVNTQDTNGTFSVVSPYNYNALLQDIRYNPMLIRRIEIITHTQGQLTQPLNITTRDANGLSVLIPRYPNIELSVNQFQPNIAYLDFHEKELILNENTVITNYTFPKQTDTRFIIYYKQLNRIDLFTHGVTQCAELEDYLHFKETFVSEADLRKESNEPYIQSTIQNELNKQRRMTAKIKFFDKKIVNK